MKTAAKWQIIQRALQIDDDGIPGGDTADHVAAAIGVEFGAIQRAVGQDGLALIRHFESCLEPDGDGYFRAYADPYYGWAVPTIGWGTTYYETGRRVARGDRISQARADELLLWEVTEKAQAVTELVTAPLGNDQFDALVSFAYNCGSGALAESTLLRLLNAGDYPGAADQFLRWNRSNGQVSRGLTRRRHSERNLFLSVRPYLVPA